MSASSNSRKVPKVKKVQPRDVVLVHNVSEDGDSMDVIRHRNDHFELGTIRALREGQPIHGEVVRLRQRTDLPLVFDVDSQLSPLDQATSANRTQGDDADAVNAETPNFITTSSANARKGPARVSTPKYRQNWENLFGRSRPKVLN